MLRWMLPFVAATLMVGPATAADLPRSGADVHHRARPNSRQTYVETEPDVLFTPSDGSIPSIRIPPHTPVLPGSATLPGYYGSTHSYEYQGPYYGGPNLGYWYRLPYACGVYGYC